MAGAAAPQDGSWVDPLSECIRSHCPLPMADLVGFISFSFFRHFLVQVLFIFFTYSFSLLYSFHCLEGQFWFCPWFLKTKGRVCLYSVRDPILLRGLNDVDSAINWLVCPCRFSCALSTLCFPLFWEEQRPCAPAAWPKCHPRCHWFLPSLGFVYLTVASIQKGGCKIRVDKREAKKHHRTPK